MSSPQNPCRDWQDTRFRSSPRRIQLTLQRNRYTQQSRLINNYDSSRSLSISPRSSSPEGSLSDLSQQLDRLATQGQNSPKGSDYQPACLLVEDLQKQPRDMLRTGRCGKVADKEIHQLLLLQYVTTYNKVQITKFHIAALVTGGNMGAEVGPVKGLLPRHADVLPQDFKIL